MPPALRTEAKSKAVLHRLLQKAAMRLRSIGHYAGGLVVQVGYRDGMRWGEEIRFNETAGTIALTRALMGGIAVGLVVGIGHVAQSYWPRRITARRLATTSLT